jgi:hypothetical protein
MIIRKHTSSDVLRSKLYLASTYFFNGVVCDPGKAEHWFRKGATVITTKDYMLLPHHERFAPGTRS